ncbi:long chain acyl-CoA synthetase 4-like, partial [Magnolia sinica]|uniref:long chain acyl-CoA synthetase 4-like n=1 Tax=Magnolia sinica TaxID=86752 RepID=UPI00265963AE
CSWNVLQLNEEDVYLSYLPLAHIFDRVIEELFISHGASIGFWRGDVKLLIEDIGELKPTIFCVVPRVLDSIYTGLTEKISSGDFLKHTLFNIAYAAPLFDKVVFSKVKQGLGGKVGLILSGAAPLATHVEAFLRVVACAHVLQGYGLTETCVGTFVSLPNELSMPNVDVCLESVPEMGYDANSSTPRGEICVRGNTLFSGYFKREDLTKEVMVGGWFHTGDIGEWQPNGSMEIIDRKKNIFKLSQGEYVASGSQTGEPCLSFFVTLLMGPQQEANGCRGPPTFKCTIISAFSVEHVKGYIYIEADREREVVEVCKALCSIYSSRVVLVPKNEVLYLLSLQIKSSEVSKGTWVLVKYGKYKGDLAQVVAVDDARKRPP